MDADDYRDYLYSRAFFRDQLLLLLGAAGVFAAADWLGVLDGFGPDAPRAYAVQLSAILIVGTWIILAVVGAIGLYRWLRS